MKKTLIIITSIIMLCIMLVGCQATDMSITTSKELNKNLNLLMNTVNRLDSLDNDYLISNDIYSLNTVQASAVPTPNRSYKKILASTNNNQNQKTNNENISTLELIADEVSLKEDLTEALKNELVNRLYCDENGNCKICKEPYTCNNNNMCNNCNQTIVCDANGNCTSCNNQLILDNNNNCSNCKKSCISNTPNTNISSSTIDCLNRISSDNEKLKINLVDTENKEILIGLDDYDNVIINDVIDNCNTPDVNNNSIGYTNTIDSTNTTADNNLYKNSNHITKDIWEEDRKRLNNSIQTDIKINTNSNENNIENDVIIDDEELDDKAIENTNDIEESNQTNTSENETTDNNKYKIIYYSENAYFPEHLRYRPRFISQIDYDNANTNLNRYVEKLQKLYTMTADVVEANNTLANYKIIILDNIGETKELNNCILEGTCTPTNNQVLALNNYIEDIKSTIKNLRNLNGNLTNEINKISTNNTGISQSIDVTNSNYLKILNQIDTRISYHENAIATLEQIKFLLQDAQYNQDKETTVEDLNKNQTVVIEDNQKVEDGTILDNNIVDTDTNINNYDNIDNNTHTEPVTNYSEEIVNIKNIDTYKNNDLSNVNSYLENKTFDSTSNETINNDEKLNNSTPNSNITNYVDNIDDNYLINDDTTSSNYENNVNTPQMVDGNNSNMINDNLVTNNNANLNNNYNNTIISQNNLESNDIGNNSYRYDNNGTLYNNTNGYNNSGLNNINENNNNVNTYKYNTLVDSINRGTINNGINTL